MRLKLTEDRGGLPITLKAKVVYKKSVSVDLVIFQIAKEVGADPNI